ncbi:Hypothetical protein FKW44_006549, partial [Caligus rogercresseyi]
MGVHHVQGSKVVQMMLSSDEGPESGEESEDEDLITSYLGQETPVGGGNGAGGSGGAHLALPHQQQSHNRIL